MSKNYQMNMSEGDIEDESIYESDQYDCYDEENDHSENGYESDSWNDDENSIIENAPCPVSVPKLCQISWCWPNGDVKMFDLGTNRLTKQNPSLVKEDEKEDEDEEYLKKFEEYNNKRNKEIAEMLEKDFMSKLPKFSAGMLAKMKKEQEEMIKPQKADPKYYPWIGGNSASNISHTAWGHRRNGGGKGKKDTMTEMNSEKAAAERAAAKRIRRKMNKEKEMIEALKRTEIIIRLQAQKASIDLASEKQVDNEKTEEEIEFDNKQKINEIACRILIVSKQLEVIKKKEQEEEDKDKKVLVYDDNKILDYLAEQRDANQELVRLEFARLESKKQKTKEDEWKLAGKKQRKPESSPVKLIVCNSVGTNKNCSYGDNCRFSHQTPSQYSQPVKSKIMCRSIGSGRKCLHGVNCRFSHQPVVQPEKQTLADICKQGFCFFTSDSAATAPVNDDKSRCDGFSALTDDKKMRETLSRTKMCNSVGSGTPCRHNNCRFAHSIKELKIGPCFFGERCNHVAFRNGKYENVINKNCTNIHPNETEADFNSRTRIKSPISSTSPSVKQLNIRHLNLNTDKRANDGWQVIKSK